MSYLALSGAYNRYCASSLSYSTAHDCAKVRNDVKLNFNNRLEARARNDLKIFKNETNLNVRDDATLRIRTFTTDDRL